MLARNLSDKGDSRLSQAHFVGPRVSHGPARLLAPLVLPPLTALSYPVFRTLCGIRKGRRLMECIVRSFANASLALSWEHRFIVILLSKAGLV
jgi:hypothetical protein